MPAYRGPSGSPGYRHDDLDPTNVNHIDHTPRKEIHAGQPLPGGRGIYDHSAAGYTPAPYDLSTTPNDSTDYADTKDDWKPEPNPVAPIPVKVVSDKGIERKMFRARSYHLDAAGTIVQLGSHNTRQKLEIWQLWQNNYFQISDDQSMFDAVAVGTNTVTITSTEPVYVRSYGGTECVINVLEHYNASVAEQ